MKNYHQFHDGWFEGLWIDGRRVHVYLSTEDRTRFTVVADDVAGLSAHGIMKGNIILDVSMRTHEELNENDVAALPELQMIDTSKSNTALERAHKQELSILEINSSYGGSCLILARSFDLLTREEWVARYMSMLHEPTSHEASSS